jgi:hypothetical protein
MTATRAADGSDLPESQQLQVLSDRPAGDGSSAAVLRGESTRAMVSTRGVRGFALLLVFTSAPPAPRNDIVDALRNNANSKLSH